MTRKHVFWFWGAMDALYLIRYAVASAIEARIPYLSDLESALWVLMWEGACPLPQGSCGVAVIAENPTLTLKVALLTHATPEWQAAQLS